MLAGGTGEGEGDSFTYQNPLPEPVDAKDSDHLDAPLGRPHVIHTKIYPRYKTYRAIELARDNFSKWLEPHESPTTDIVLVGHSMGGILAADVVLLVRSLIAPEFAPMSYLT